MKTTQEKIQQIIRDFDEWLAGRVIRHELKHEDLPTLNDAFRMYFVDTRSKYEFCASCGQPPTPHEYRHPYRRWAPGMPLPRSKQ